MSNDVDLRPIVREDIPFLADLITAGFEEYRSFAPAGWRPPRAGEQAGVLRRWVGHREFWGEAATAGHGLIGLGTFTPASRHLFKPVHDPHLCHLGYLFVTPSYWGEGVATWLLAHAGRHAVERGYEKMRLFTPVGQERARAFYRREGFMATGEPFDFGLGIPVLEYRRELIAQ